MPLSLAEEAAFVVGIDPAERFQDAGVRLGRERDRRNLPFALADGMYLPFRDRDVRPRAVARGDRARRGRAAVPARVRARAGAGRARLPVDGAVPVVRRRAPAAAEGAGAAAPDGRTARRVRDVPVPRPARGLDAEGAGERELVHQGGAARRGQARRPAREGPRGAAAAADRRRRAADRPRGAARDRDGPAAARRRRRAGCATAR